jgi:protein-L-isoaspartate(D-aspartate) O-methyltransferase
MDFENARFNMVEQQIRPWDVLDPKILDLLFHVKREDFVAADKRQLAFVDTELPLPNGGKMLQPKLEAVWHRMLPFSRKTRYWKSAPAPVT